MWSSITPSIFIVRRWFYHHSNRHKIANPPICEPFLSQVNSTHDGPRDAVSRLRKRLKQTNPKVQLLCLATAEALVRNCAGVRGLVGGREFMERVVKLVDRQGVSVAVAGWY
jgi:hypothetical protein